MSTQLIALTRQGIGVARLAENDSDPAQSRPQVREYPMRLTFTCLIADTTETDETTRIAHDTGPRLLAGTQGQGVWESRDGGATWNHIGLPGIIVKSLRRTCTGLLAGTKNPPLIYSSTDGGFHWEELTGFRNIPSRPLWFSPAEKPYTAYVMGADQSPDAPEHLIAGMEAGAVVHSGDGGQHWTDHLPGAMRDCHAIGYHPRDGRYAYAVGGNSQGAALSRDAGTTWIDCRAGLQQHYAWSFVADPHTPEHWYIAAAPGPRQAHSDDGSAQATIYRTVAPLDETQAPSWEPLQNGLPTPLPSMPYSLVIPRHQPDHIYAGLRNGEVYVSANRGDRWQRLPFQFDGICRALLVEPV